MRVEPTNNGGVRYVDDRPEAARVQSEIWQLHEKQTFDAGYRLGWEHRNPLPGMLITALSGAIVGLLLGAWLL